MLRCSPTGPTLTIDDGGSRNGTFVNGARISSADLLDGDVIRTGDSFFVVRFEPRDVEDSVLPELIGVSPGIRQVRHEIALVGPTDRTVLIAGETGCGKELVAQALHAASKRKGTFVAVNCGAIPESLAESQLFGHVAGAFTGANRAHDGFFKMADGGTLFLDELGELSGAIQPKLLRVLEDSQVLPVGGNQPKRCSVRVVSATDSDLLHKMRISAFRKALFARLSGIRIKIPALRERREDILLILEKYLEGVDAELAPNLVDALLSHPWPFNVRELVRLAEELVLRGQGKSMLTLDMVKDRLASVLDDTATETDPVPSPEPKQQMPVPSKDELREMLERLGGNISALARECGRSRRQVRRWLVNFGLEPAVYQNDK